MYQPGEPAPKDRIIVHRQGPYCRPRDGPVVARPLLLAPDEPPDCERTECLLEVDLVSHVPIDGQDAPGVLLAQRLLPVEVVEQVEAVLRQSAGQSRTFFGTGPPVIS